MKNDRFEDYEKLSVKLSETLKMMKERLNEVDAECFEGKYKWRIDSATFNNPLNEIKGEMQSEITKNTRDGVNSYSREQHLRRNKNTPDNPYPRSK